MRHLLLAPHFNPTERKKERQKKIRQGKRKKKLVNADKERKKFANFLLHSQPRLNKFSRLRAPNRIESFLSIFFFYFHYSVRIWLSLRFFLKIIWQGTNNLFLLNFYDLKLIFCNSKNFVEVVIKNSWKLTFFSFCSQFEISNVPICNQNIQVYRYY